MGVGSGVDQVVVLAAPGGLAAAGHDAGAVARQDEVDQVLRWAVDRVSEVDGDAGEWVADQAGELGVGGEPAGLVGADPAAAQ